MKSRIIHLPIANATPGMILAMAIIDHANRILFTAGTALDAAMLDRLNKRGIETIAALVIDTRSAEVIAEEIHAAELQVMHIFRGPGSPARDALRSAILTHRLESAQ